MALSWRRDPEESLSDWTIIVSSVSTNGYYENVDNCDSNDDEDNRVEMTTKYHIHKVVVGAGPRGSNYFFRLFKNETNSNDNGVVPLLTSSSSPSSNQERAMVKYTAPSPLRRFLFGGGYYNNYTNNKNDSACNGGTARNPEDAKTSHIELERSAAVAFPIMLDFMYAHSSVDVQATTKTAVALRYLGKVFDIPTLVATVNNFIRHDMTKDNIHIYVQQATVFHDEQIVQLTMQTAAPAWYELFFAPSTSTTAAPTSPSPSLTEEQVEEAKKRRNAKHDIDGDDDDDGSVSKDPQHASTPARKKCRYMELLPASKHVELLQLSILNAGSDLRHVREELRHCREEQQHPVRAGATTLVARNDDEEVDPRHSRNHREQQLHRHHQERQQHQLQHHHQQEQPLRAMMGIEAGSRGRNNGGGCGGDGSGLD